MDIIKTHNGWQLIKHPEKDLPIILCPNDHVYQTDITYSIPHCSRCFISLSVVTFTVLAATRNILHSAEGRDLKQYRKW